MEAESRSRTDRVVACALRLGLAAASLGLSAAPSAAQAPAAQPAPNFVGAARALLDGSGEAIGDPETAAQVAAQAIRLLSAGELEQRLWDSPERVPALYRTFGAGLAHGGARDSDGARLLDYTMQVAVLRIERLSRLGAMDSAGAPLDLLVALLQVDPRRFHQDEAFRRRVTAEWGRVADVIPSARIRERLLQRATQGLAGDFDQVEVVALRWRLAGRSTAERHRPDAVLDPGGSIGAEAAPIDASFFSIPEFIDPSQAAQLLTSIGEHSPARRILVLADSMRSRLLATKLTHLQPAQRTKISFLPSQGLDYSPWPRDPMSWLRRSDGGLHLVLRGNVQRGREADQWLGRALIQGLPEDLDRHWGRPTWHRTELPFHNGQVLDAGGASWLSVHSLEPRILELLGMERLPVERFAGDDGWRFVRAAHTAAAELAELRGRPVRFVHALPADDATGAERLAALLALGGGAGIDLDSVLTLLPQDAAWPQDAALPQDAAGRLVALVGDLDLGRSLLAAATADELAGLATYGATTRDQLPADELDRFLERIAEHLASEGISVRRLPLLQLDPAKGVRPGDSAPEPFLLTWNNVVLESTLTGDAAEGFASGLAAGDAWARRVFAEAGYGLRLHPPLVGSIVRNGGYRCASQHVRASLTAPGPESRVTVP